MSQIPPVHPPYLQEPGSHKSTAGVERQMNWEMKERENMQADAVHCNERDRLASKQTNCNKAYSLLKIDEE